MNTNFINVGIDALLTINKPANVLAGDILIAHLSGVPSMIPDALDNKWTMILHNDTGPLASYNFHSTIYYKIAGEHEPENYSWILSTIGSQGAIMAYRGVDTINPINAKAGRYTWPWYYTTPSIVTTVDNAMVVAFFGVDAFEVVGAKERTFEPPEGMTERYEVCSDDNCESGDDMIQTFAGETGNKTVTFHPYWVPGTAQIIALKPEDGSDGTDYTDRSCNIDGSASSTKVKCGLGSVNKNEDSTDATSDTCTDGTNNNYMHIEDIFVDATTVSTTDAVQVTCEVCCYSSGTEYAILYNNGSGWVNKKYGNCINGSASLNCTFLENKTVSIPIDNVVGTHYFRCWESYSGCTASNLCCNSTYADNDDMSINVI